MVVKASGGLDEKIANENLRTSGKCDTIADSPPKFGLAVTGIVHPDRVISNTGARPGEVLVLAKPVGTGAWSRGNVSVSPAMPITGGRSTPCAS